MNTLRIVGKCIAAGVLIGVGTVLLVLPGPGTPLILAGIALLGTEFAWAERLSQRLLDLGRALWRRASPA